MPRTGSRPLLAFLAVLGVIPAAQAPARAQQEQQEPAVLSGIQYLRGRAANQQVGETAMIALAMLKADAPKTDPVLASCIATIQKRFTGSGYSPQRRGGHDIYEAAVVAMALSVQSRQRRISRRYQPGRHLPDWHAKGERVMGLCPAEPRRLLDLSVCPARTLGV
ncbi:MAG: hypothetical protein ABSH35_32535 [Isosphaeraceae bacterium]|jgi:hypothetical protein